jgi:hypothetical protein
VIAYGLNGLLAAHDAFLCDTAGLRPPGPIGCQQFAERDGGFDLSGLDPAMTFSMVSARPGSGDADRTVEGGKGRKACSILAFKPGWLRLTVKK